MPVAVKKAAKKAVTRKVNREGQRWTDDRSGMTLRLPLDLREAITEESRVKGDLARIVLYALDHVDNDAVEIQQTRKAGMELTNPQLLHVGAEARTKLKNWAEAEGVSVNAIVVSLLDEFFKRLKKSKARREACGRSFVCTGVLCHAESILLAWLQRTIIAYISVIFWTLDPQNEPTFGR